MTHYKSYRKLIDKSYNPLVGRSIDQTVREIMPKYISSFDFRSHKSGLLLGNVQSGKTGHMLGVLSAAADNDFEVFIILTTDSVHLQKQTLDRSLCLLDSLCVCDEQDDIRFLSNDMRKPVVIVLKKNNRVLETWKNNLISSNFLQGRPVFIIDDESDAASPNTKINQDDQSTINKRISEIRKIANSSFYLQVTATPQSLFLQEQGEYRPEFVYYFEPGEGYLGINIVVGGNCLGRGFTFPNLQTTYYCRKSKKPQADTFWQHCCAFGYDRDPGLVRVFLPASLLKLFTDLNNANNAITTYLANHGVEGLQLIYPNKVYPTRANVINKKKLEIIAGGVNQFPSFPTTQDRDKLDDATQHYEQDGYTVVDLEVIKNLLNYTHAEVENDWPTATYINCINSLEKKDQAKAILIVRRNRKIAKDTGTLLSQDDRALGQKFPNNLVLTLYRITGDYAKGWDGEPLWIPNIKFPEGKFFYSTSE